MEKVLLEAHKKAFLASYSPSKKAVTRQDIALESAVNASLRRNPTYSQTITKQDKADFISFWRKEIVTLGEKYLHDNQAVETFISDVDTMKLRINDRFGGFLNNRLSNGIRVAHCQKSLALYLKYMWCSGEATVEPPVCPIDRTVLFHCGINDSWIQLNSVKKYKGILNQMKAAVEKNPCCNSMAEWELCVFNLVIKKNK